MAPAFSRILLAYDESEASRMALRYACGLAESGAALAVTHPMRESNFIASAATAGGFPPIDPKPMIDAVDESGDFFLKAAVHACGALGIAAEKVFAHGPPVDAVGGAGRQVHADLIVVGTHARKGIARAVHGSVAESILRTSEVPVLVITRHMKAPRNKPVFRRALVAIDESDPSTAALLIAARLATGAGTRLTLCNVDDSADFGDDDAQSLEPDVSAAVAFFFERATAVKDIAPFLDDEIVVEGEPANAIEHAAMQRNCDVIIVGSHGRRGLQRLWDGSVAETVARSSAVPVLVVPVPRRSGPSGRSAPVADSRIRG
jgi:nucleotide-binding universal stress UspA family protein